MLLNSDISEIEYFDISRHCLFVRKGARERQLVRSLERYRFVSISVTMMSAEQNRD